MRRDRPRPGEVRAGLADRSAYVTHDDRASFVSFATTADNAASWAQRAPEVRWEVLTTSWLLDHPETDGISDDKPDYWRWMWPPMEPEPVVVGASVTLGKVRAPGWGKAEGLVDDAALWPAWPEVCVDLPAADAGSSQSTRFLDAYTPTLAPLS